MSTNRFVFYSSFLASCTIFIENTVGRFMVRKSVDFEQFKQIQTGEYGFRCDFTTGIPIILVPLEKDTIKLIIDTGAYSTLSENLSKKLGGTLTELNRSSSDINNEISKRPVVFFDCLNLGGMTFKDIAIPVQKKLPLNADGLLGIDFLDDKLISFDKEQGVIKIFFDRKKRKGNYENEIRLRKKWNQKYYLKAGIKKKKYTLLFDSGSNGFVHLKKNISNLTDSVYSSITRKEGMHSEAYWIEHKANLDSVIIDDFTLKNIPFSFSAQYDMNSIGFPSFSNHPVIFDFKKNKIYTVIKEVELDEKISRSLLTLGFRDHLVVVEVSTKYFNENGVLPGDRVVTINNQITPQNLDSIKTLFKHLKSQHIDTLYLDLEHSDSIYSIQVPFNQF